MYTIEAHDVWLKFNVKFVGQEMSLRRYLVQAFSPGKIAQLLRGERHKESPSFWALRGVSLKVKPKEIVGLMGANGAGKSTMLMTLAGIYAPDRGTVSIKGKIGTLLSLGAGFSPEMTGIENIRQSSIFLGLTPVELKDRFDSIVELADLGEFINAPVKTYSSGMRARLGFSIAININPDVILLDEVLEAGDQAFRNRSNNLLQTFRDQNKTVVMASHSTSVLKEFCNRVIWLDHGKIVAEGVPAEVIPLYHESTKASKTKSILKK